MIYHVCQYCETKMPGSAMESRRRGQMQCRSDIACFNRLLPKFRAMKRAGAMLANIAYNLSQHSGKSLTDAWCQTMRESYDQWVEAKRGATR